MKAAVIRFPGSNCDQDCVLALNELGLPTDYVWHKETSVAGYDLVVLPGGFSYGDYLRCGAIARYSPIMQAVKEYAASGKLLIGICNGFQILCEAGLLPGALIRNRSLHFVCQHQYVRVEDVANPFLHLARTGAALRIPIAHGEGGYVADAATLRNLDRQGRILLRYVDAGGAATDAANPNGSLENIAGMQDLWAALNVTVTTLGRPDSVLGDLLATLDHRAPKQPDINASNHIATLFPASP